MTTTIGGARGLLIEPDYTLIGSADTDTSGRSITHEILDGAPVHTLRTGSPRTGTLRLLFNQSNRAHATQTSLSAAEIFVVTSTDDPTINNMRILVTGCRVQQHDKIGTYWTVEVEYEAVS